MNQGPLCLVIDNFAVDSCSLAYTLSRQAVAFINNLSDLYSCASGGQCHTEIRPVMLQNVLQDEVSHLGRKEVHCTITD